jgi:Abnormal spindle-like microcephaly-assoc'd, ASPM-SPD-2-Hydin
MGKVFRLRLALGLPLLAASLGLLSGCAGVSSSSPSQPSGNNPSSGQLAVTPATLAFGTVTVGSSSTLPGTLTASNADVTVSSAEWNGQGYSISGITFPVTVNAGKSVKYNVSFDPQAAGSVPGSISFVSNASNSPANQTLSGSGSGNSTNPSGHSVSLNWDPSSSTVSGYNIYRGTQSGGPYSKLNSALLSTTSYSDTSVQSGTTYYYVATAVNSSNVESSYSNQATADIP